eukprot:2059742-Pyramimonas_sp.AAC.1
MASNGCPSANIASNRPSVPPSSLARFHGLLNAAGIDDFAAARGPCCGAHQLGKRRLLGIVMTSKLSAITGAQREP